MNSNNKTDSDDRPSTDRGMNTNRRDDSASQGHRDDSTGHETNPGDRGKWLSPLIAVLGVWMIALAFVLDVTGSHFWSAVLVGALLIGVGAYNYSRQANERLANSAIALIAVAAGLWLIAAPYVLGGDAGLTETAYELWFYNHIAVGLLAVGLGAYSAYMARDHQQDTRQTKA